MAVTGFASVVIVAPPGRLRAGLRVLLRDTTGLRVAGECDDALSALRFLAQQPTDVVVIDAGLGISAWALLAQIKRDWPAVRCVCLTHNDEQQRRAQAAGALGSFMSGCAADVIKRVIRDVLTEETKSV